jgi:hypothetical protein
VAQVVEQFLIKHEALSSNPKTAKKKKKKERKKENKRNVNFNKHPS